MERVTVGAMHYDVEHKPERGNNPDQEDINLASTDIGKVSHTTARDAGKVSSKHIDIVDFGSFVQGEPPFATFTFHCRSEEMLRKFGFEGFPAAATTTSKVMGMKGGRRKRDVEAALAAAALIQLSALQPGEVQGLSKGVGGEAAVLDLSVAGRAAVGKGEDDGDVSGDCDVGERSKLVAVKKIKVSNPEEEDEEL